MSIAAIAYCGMNILFVIYNKMRFHRVLNTLNIYLVIWLSMVGLYGLRLINYNNTSVITWIIVFISTVLVFIGYHLGDRTKIMNTTVPYEFRERDERKLRKSIIHTSLFSMIAIIPNIAFLVQRYGINLLSKTTQIYYDNINGFAPPNIPYIGAVIYVACILVGIYFALFGFNIVLLLPTILAMLVILPSGSRGWLILTVFFILFPVIALKKRRTGIISSKKKKQNKRRIILVVVAILTLFICLTINRSKFLDPGIYQYISPRMIPIAYVAPWLFKLYQYFASPVGVLNAFLEDPTFYFGENTFNVLYNFFNKMGFDIKYSRYQPNYNIPIETNVGTWLLELSHDFTIIGMLFVIFLFSFIVGYCDKKALFSKQISDVVIATVLDTILAMSFFVWYIREGTMIVVLLVCILLKSKEYFRIN